MKRSNAIILGTILVFLVGIILFMQTGTDPFVNKKEPGHDHDAPVQQAADNEAGVLSPDSVSRSNREVTADDLADTMTDPAAAEQGKAVPATPHREKFRGLNTQPAEPTSRWYDPNRKAGDSK